MITEAPIIVVAGPTASGKSDVSIALAGALNAEVVVADSMQVYRGMDIGTAKIPPAQRSVLHHCIDLVDPGAAFSSALYQQYARKAFSDIRTRDHNVVLSGGTGFYLRAAIDDYDFPEGEQTDNSLRVEHDRIVREQGAQALWDKLAKCDPLSAADVHPNNTKRVSRALELYAQGISYHDQLRRLKTIPQVYDAILFCLDVDRDVLCERISSRVDQMRECGLIAEVEGLLNAGYRDAVTAQAAIGYKEIVAALDGRCTMDKAFDDIVTATRRYAKRQRSWFGADARYRHIDATCAPVEELASRIAKEVRAQA